MSKRLAVSLALSIGVLAGCGKTLPGEYDGELKALTAFKVNDKLTKTPPSGPTHVVIKELAKKRGKDERGTVEFAGGPLAGCKTEVLFYSDMKSASFDKTPCEIKIEGTSCQVTLTSMGFEVKDGDLQLQASVSGVSPPGCDGSIVEFKGKRKS